MPGIFADSGYWIALWNPEESRAPIIALPQNK